MHSRRDFLRNAAALGGAAFAAGSVPEAIARALAIDPAKGTTFLDAEHIVVLMQENRSFDHSYGALRGVRGFRDPRVHVQPNGKPVWFQSDAQGVTYPPFRLDITGTSATWIGGLPHSWTDQIDARNGGSYDKWLIAKPKRDLPFTLGHYGREDIPFYYALADAFTICDQAFCSSLTGTTPNRLFLWSGGIRRDAQDFPRVQNEDTLYDREAAWRTFPERLEDAGVSWRIYQNDIGMDTGLSDDEDGWLANFQDNPIEWFTQFNIRFAKSRRAWLPKLIAELPARIVTAEQAAQVAGLTTAEATRRRQHVEELKAMLQAAPGEQRQYDEAAWNALSPRLKSIHERAFTTNVGDPRYRSLATLSYQDGATPRDVKVPAGDVLFQFRRDVAANKLPAVSWLVAPENFSDHPSAPWYGAWYVSEALDILTKNPDVWKKTIFVLCYDENDGYFDHVPPFVAPHPHRPETGIASPGIDTSVEWANVYGRDHPIGLGYRVPLVVVSPWSRGGAVDSQVFDHTSIIRLMETWLAAKGKHVRETNISEWRRTVCGDLSSVFRRYDGQQLTLPAPIGRNATVERIYTARFQKKPVGPAAGVTDVGALQEKGTRPSAPLPYALHVNVEPTPDGVVLVMAARKDVLGQKSEGAPFSAYRYDDTKLVSRAYAVRAGSVLRDAWEIDGAYHLRVDGPNGFMREFVDDDARSALRVAVDHSSGVTAKGDIRVRLANPGGRVLDVVLADESYHAPPQQARLNARATTTLVVHTAASHGWYDFTVRSGGLAYRYAGRVETGKWSITDPAMGEG
jgi:phospholipase C